MENVFYTVRRDESLKVPLLPPRADGTYHAEVLPFTFDEQENTHYYQLFYRILSHTELLDMVDEGTVLYTPMADPMLYERRDLPTNPHFQHINPKLPLEIALYYGLLIFNEDYRQNILQEKELYYIFKNALATHNQRIPDPVYHFAANILYNELRHNDFIALLDLAMLPALMLLLPAMEEGTRVLLPAHDPKYMRNEAYKLLVRFFQKEIPRIKWHAVSPDVADFKEHLTSKAELSVKNNSPCDACFLPSKCLVLGTLLPESDRFAHEAVCLLRPARGGFLFTSWNFLARASFEKWRYFLLKESTLRAIIQLPKLLRSGTKDYGAGLILAESHRGPMPIRMCYMPPSLKEGDAALDQASIVSHVNGNTDDGQLSFEVQRNHIQSMVDLRLSPSVYFVENSIPEADGRLGDYAEVLFYSKPRKKIIVEETGGMYNTPQISGDEVHAQEISLGDIDASSSFVFAEEKKFTKIKMNTLLNKYLVQNNDILLAFKGSATSVGKSGFVVKVDSLGYTITNQSTCIIRARDYRYTVWLYYQLKSPKAQEWIRANSSGTNALVISLEMLKNLPLDAYDKSAADELYTLHRQMLEDYKMVNVHKKNLRKTRSDIKTLLGW